MWSTAPTTCRDGWLGFLFRWRTQQSAISGINCRIIQVPNLWTQTAHGRSSLESSPCMPYFSVSNKKKPSQHARECVVIYVCGKKYREPMGITDETCVYTNYICVCILRVWSALALLVARAFSFFSFHDDIFLLWEKNTKLHSWTLCFFTQHKPNQKTTREGNGKR